MKNATIFLVFVATIMFSAGIVTSSVFAQQDNAGNAPNTCIGIIFNDTPLTYDCCEVDQSKDKNDPTRYHDCVSCTIWNAGEEMVKCEHTNNRPMKVSAGTVNPNIKGSGAGVLQGDSSGQTTAQSTTSPNTTTPKSKSFPGIIGTNPELLQGENALPPKTPTIPSKVNLRIVIDSIQVFADHDGPTREDGEWHLFGVIGCCGGAANSNMPTKGFSFNAPGQPEGEVDTPDGQMNDVTGTFGGQWGTAESVPMKVFQDIEVDNTNPLTELRLDFFGFENDALDDDDLPTVRDIPGTAYDDYARQIGDTIRFLNNLAGNDDLGTADAVFTKTQNYGVGFGTLVSKKTYQNIWYDTQREHNLCQTPGTAGKLGLDCLKNKNWPDFPEYVISYHIEDREPRCTAGFQFQYATGICKPVVIQ